MYSYLYFLQWKKEYHFRDWVVRNQGLAVIFIILTVTDYEYLAILKNAPIFKKILEEVSKSDESNESNESDKIKQINILKILNNVLPRSDESSESAELLDESDE
ncbi:4638_t:CDS:2, partial [Racocetra fulgida]